MNLEAQHLCKSIMKACDIDFNSKSISDLDGATKIDASCSAASDTKSSAIQTDMYKVKKVLNNTTTTKVQLLPKIETRTDEFKAHVCDIHAIITLNVVTRNPANNSKTSSVESSDVSGLTNRSCLGNGNESKFNKCTCTIDECAQKGRCVESCKYSCTYGGFGPCNAFSLGTADYRILLREKCNSMLIGGCRVPVSRNFKNKL